MHDNQPLVSKGPKFTKVYEKGMAALESMAACNTNTARVWLFIVRYCGHDNALVCNIETIAEELAIGKRTVSRALASLQTDGHLRIAKIGTANVYVLDPTEVWKTYEEHKHFCSFGARTLVSKKQNKDFLRRITHKLPELEAA